MQKIKGFQKIDLAIGKATKEICQKKGFLFVKILIDWHKIIPTKYDGHCKALKINHYKGKNTLLVAVYNSALLMEMQYAEPQLLDKLRLYLGQNYIDKIKLLHQPQPAIKPTPEPTPTIELSPTAQAQLSNQLADINDENIKNSLQRLAIRLSNKQTF